MSKATTGTYSQSGYTITCTTTGSAIWSVGQEVRISFSTGTASYIHTTIVTGGVDTFTVTAGNSLTTSGNCSITSWDIVPTLDIQKLVSGTIVDLFELDYSMLTNGDTLYFHPGVNGLLTDVKWQGITYSRYPIEVEGFERSTSGTLPRPKVKVANIMGAVSSLAYSFQDLVGAKVIRRRTFIKYLDAVNFISGNPYADPNVGFPDEIWYVDRKSSENGIFVEFELSTAFDVTGVLLPRRHCIQNTCIWAYRGAECGYAGGPVATKNDVPTTDANLDKCGKRLASCKLRFGATAELPFGAFPGVGLLRS